MKYVCGTEYILTPTTSTTEYTLRGTQYQPQHQKTPARARASARASALAPAPASTEPIHELTRYNYYSPEYEVTAVI
jgi:hypothetical protein